MVNCDRCDKKENCKPIVLTSRMLNTDSTYALYLCSTCLFQLQMMVQIWIDESEKDSEIYKMYGERSELSLP